MKFHKIDDFFMNLALKKASEAFKKKEVPVGAVLVKKGELISTACNLRESKKNPTGHAEILVIEKASKKLRSWRLEDCQLYVSLEPCLMCIGAIIQARIPELIYACPDLKTGFSSYYKLDKKTEWKHKIKIRSGLCSQESSLLLKEFFKKLRA
ncbi:MAG: nucleoside deaminase [Bdellovibrionaceae bacterium]|nr:nucleoside deaminase [Pseudobdellovibrionaceae bacterium]